MQPVDAKITSPPSPPNLPWDATREGAVGPWQDCDGGKVNLNTGRLTGEDFPDSDPWKQT